MVSACKLKIAGGKGRKTATKFDFVYITKTGGMCYAYTNVTVSISHDRYSSRWKTPGPWDRQVCRD